MMSSTGNSGSSPDAAIPFVADQNTDFEVRSLDGVCVNESEIREPFLGNIKYFVAGLWFGLLLVKSEVISWFRIQEMFRLQSFHMYGVIGSAVAIGMLSVWMIKKFRLKTIQGEQVEFRSKRFHRGNVYGGLLFGAGWALTGACPGPLYAQIGTGALVVTVTLASAIAGTWVYGLLRDRL